MVDSTEPRIAIVWQPLQSDILFLAHIAFGIVLRESDVFSCSKHCLYVLLYTDTMSTVD